MAELVSSSSIRVGAVRGRYFRENFAQGGIDLVQVVPELVTNADAAIAASGRERGRIELRFGAPDTEFMAAWRAQMRALRVPALASWRFEVRCADDGVGVDAATVERRLGVLGELPERREGRGLFGRGLRDVWPAQGAGRIEGVRDGRAIESWFFPAARDDPFAYIHVRDEPAPGVRSGARVTVPLAAERLPPDGRLRTLVSQLVQLRPVLEDPERELWLELPSGAVEVMRAPVPEPDPDRPVLFDDEVKVTKDVRARVTARRAAAVAGDVARHSGRRTGGALRSGGARVDVRGARGRAGHAQSLRRGALRRARGPAARCARASAPAGRSQGGPQRAQ